MIYAGKKYTGKGVAVAVINTGIDCSVVPLHSAWTVSLQSSGQARIALRTENNSGGGTKVAQCLLSEAPDVDLMAIDIFNKKGQTSSDLLAAAIEVAYRANASIINISFGTSNMGKADLLEDVCKLAVEAGSLIIASGRPSRGVSYPADILETIGVISHRDCKKKTYYFDPFFFPEIDWKLMSDKIMCSGYWSDRYRGASYAAARFTGMIACLREAKPSLPIMEIREIIRQRAYLPISGFGYN